MGKNLDKKFILKNIGGIYSQKRFYQAQTSFTDQRKKLLQRD